ncbi:hypothetical protein ACWNYO_00780 [Candidatus Vidania fulgoroideorum]
MNYKIGDKVYIKKGKKKFSVGYLIKKKTCFFIKNIKLLFKIHISNIFIY